MKLAICNETFQESSGGTTTHWPWERICPFVAGTGYDAIEIAPFTLAHSVADVPPQRRAEIRRVAEDAGLEIAGLHWLLVSPQGLYINHPDAAVRAKTRDYLRHLVDFCGDVGGHVMVLGSPKQRSVFEGLTYQQAWDLAKETISGVLDLAAQRGVTLCLEPLTPAETDFWTTAAEVRKFAAELDHPNCRIILDVKAMSSEAQPPADIIRRSKGWVAHVHANDANMRGPGFGDTDFAPVSAALREIGYDGCVSVEVFDYSPDPETIARDSLRYLKQHFD